MSFDSKGKTECNGCLLETLESAEPINRHHQ